VPQHVITKDNVSIAVDGAMTVRVVDTYKSCYHAVNPAEMLVAVANGIIRKIVGSMNVDDLYHNRDTINKAVRFLCAYLRMCGRPRHSNYAAFNYQSSIVSALVVIYHSTCRC
jgi:hypothetical protein